MEVVTRTIVRSVYVTQPQGPQPGPWPAKKREKMARQTKTAGAELEDFVY